MWTKLKINKTQCQLCKRLAGPIISLSWSVKGFHIYGSDHWGAVSNHFPVYEAIFGMVTNKQTPEQPGGPREACYWPVQSFAIEHSDMADAFFCSNEWRIVSKTKLCFFPTILMHSVMVAMMVVMVCRRNQNQSGQDLNDRLGRKDSTLLPAERTNAAWVTTNCKLLQTITNLCKILQNTVMQ